MFDWPSFLTARGINYVTSGPSVTRGNIGIKCPFCNDDPSEHMAISIEGKGWRCWRRREHGGKSNARLVAALIHCSMEQAHQIVGTTRHMPSDFMGTLQGLLTTKEPVNDTRKLRMPDEFKRFTGGRLERPFAQYLERRGFENPAELSDDYGLRYCMRGPFGYRIIFPVRYEGRLVNWSGRHIGNNGLRYKTLTTDEDKAKETGEPLGLGPISNYLLWYDNLTTWDADTLILCEGPFDALKLNYLGERHGIAATCFFTIAPSEQQIDLLHTVAQKFKRRYLIQDAGAQAEAIRTNARLISLGIKIVQLPRGIKDPGELTRPQFKDVLSLLQS